jgi:hypothetical protein
MDLGSSIEQPNGSKYVRNCLSHFQGHHTLGLKANSMTSPGSAVMLFGEYVMFPPGPTWTLVFLSPPIGSPFGGDVLIEAFLVAALKASIVLPVVGALMA